MLSLFSNGWFFIVTGVIGLLAGVYGTWAVSHGYHLLSEKTSVIEPYLTQEHSSTGDNVGGNKYETNNFYGSSGSAQRPPETRTVPLNYPTKSGLQADLLTQGYKIHWSTTEMDVGWEPVIQVLDDGTRITFKESVSGLHLLKQKIENKSPPLSLPIKREFTKRTPRDLLSFYSSDRTQLEANRLIQPYTGQWIEIQEKIVDVGHGAPDGDQTAVILKKNNDQIECRFRREWKEKLDRLAKGDLVKIIGKISPAQNGSQLYLLECELL